jgi:class 3 adenylate cyclase
VYASRVGWPDEELSIATSPALQFDNQTSDEQLFILERVAWTDQAATAAEVTLLQMFRDLFANEALRPGERISVGSLAVMFTDLRNSTRLYREIGDAPAFGVVMSHFDVLRDAVIAEGGAIVKTIGDSVMAIFRNPAAALRAALRAQQELGSLPRPLALKAGIHYGPCIAVTLNDRLDYFGSTVNIASRLETLSTGDDVIVSMPVREDPEVAEWLTDPKSGLAVDPVRATL